MIDIHNQVLSSVSQNLTTEEKQTARDNIDVYSKAEVNRNIQEATSGDDYSTVRYCTRSGSGKINLLGFVQRTGFGDEVQLDGNKHGYLMSDDQKDKIDNVKFTAFQLFPNNYDNSGVTTMLYEQGLGLNTGNFTEDDVVYGSVVFKNNTQNWRKWTIFGKANGSDYMSYSPVHPGENVSFNVPPAGFMTVPFTFHGDISSIGIKGQGNYSIGTDWYMENLQVIHQKKV